MDEFLIKISWFPSCDVFSFVPTQSKMSRKTDLSKAQSVLQEQELQKCTSVLGDFAHGEEKKLYENLIQFSEELQKV